MHEERNPMTTITIDRAVVEEALEALIENARLLGATQAKKDFGCYSQEDARLERAWHEGIAKHSAALRAALAQEPPELPLEDALSKAYYYTEEGEWRGSEVRDWDRWHAVAKVAVALIQRPALAESREHITDGTPCWCGSEAVYTDPDTGASVILHKRPQ